MTFVTMEIMKPLNSSLARACASTALLLWITPGAHASTLVLHQIPQSSAETRSATSQSELGPQATFALVNFDLAARQNKARALYVSSGNDLSQARDIIDEKVATSFAFAAEDNSPIAIIDLGRTCAVRRLAATYGPHAGSMDFYVMQSLPGTLDENSPGALSLDSDALAKLKPSGSSVDDGTQGHASLNLAGTNGRFVMLRWSPASKADGAFTLAEVSAYDSAGGNLLASNVNFSNASAPIERHANERTANQHRRAADSKDVPDSKDIVESKDIPEEGPLIPPPLPDTPQFTFIPQLVPVSK
jgi:hypothetical protein